MWWWLVTLALAVLVWGYCLFAVDPASSRRCSTTA
jgi:hypothetical protein